MLQVSANSQYLTDHEKGDQILVMRHATHENVCSLSGHSEYCKNWQGCEGHSAGMCLGVHQFYHE